MDEPVPLDSRAEQDVSETPGAPSGEPTPEVQLQAEVEALTGRMTPHELSHCSPQQLVHMHDQLGGMMRRVVVELQTRLSCQTDS